MKNKLSSSVGPLNRAADNMHAFCLNMIYASACSMTVQAWQMLDKDTATPQNVADRDFYLETLFLKPLEENV